MESTLSAAHAACPESQLLTADTPVSTLDADSGRVFLATGAVSLPAEALVFSPADAGEATKCAKLTSGASRLCVIAVNAEPTPAATAPSDVVETGKPNLYLDEPPGGNPVLIITSGTSLSAAFDAADRLRASGEVVHIVNVPTLSPFDGTELERVAGAARTAVIVAGHPLAAAMLPGVVSPYLGTVPTVVVGAPDANAIYAAAGTPDSTGNEPESSGPPLADKLSRLGTENAFVVLAVVNKLKAEGRDIVSFAIGEPDFPTPKNIKMAGVEAITSDKTHYSESQGIVPLRQAVADYIGRTRGIDVGPGNVVITPGAKPIMFNTIMSVVNPGDEVIYPNPGFPIYESLIDFVGAKAVPMPLWESLDFNFDPDEFRGLISDRTKLIILNSPQNPTGSILTPEALAAVAEVAIERDLWVLSDEIYSQMVYDGEFHSITQIPGMKERTIILDGFSKTYSMTGWRLGFGVMPEELATWQARIETNLNSCTATFTQWAGVEALNGDQSESLAMIAEFDRRRHFIHEGLNSLPGFSCIMPRGAFYAFPNVTEACRTLGKKNARELQEHILFEGNVAVLPRTAFGRPIRG